MKRISLTLITIVMLAGCAEMPSLIQMHDDSDKPAYARGGDSTVAVASRGPLDVPPELRADVEVPMPNDIASDNNISAAEMKSVAGKAVSLDARLYDVDAAKVFSAVVDGLTALNRPVQSVDSPSGTITTDWVRQGVDSSITSSLIGMFGGGGSGEIMGIRYRFVVRVFRQNVEGAIKTRLEVRTIGQVFTNKHWVNRPIKRKVSEELFSTVEERLQIVQQKAASINAE